MNQDYLLSRLFPAVPVPFDAHGKFQKAAQEAYVDYMSRQGVGGVAVWAHTGRGLRLDAETRRDVLKSWRAGLPREMRIVAAAGATPGERNPAEAMRSARAMAEEAAQLGADALLVYPPVAMRGRIDQDRLVLEYHAEVARAGLPMILFYLYETAGGISYSPVILTQLLARPDVIGIKVATLDRVMTFQEIARLLRNHSPHTVLMTGEDRFLGYSLMCGARSALIGMAAARVGLQKRFLDAYWNRDAQQFLELNHAIDDLAQHTFLAPLEGYIQRMLWCLALDGVIPESAAHDPWGPRLGAGEYEAVRACLARLGTDS